MKRRLERDTEFRRFAIRYAPALLRAAYTLLGDLDLADDAVQVTMFRVFRRWNRARDAPDAYSRATLVNVCRDQWRTERRRPVETPLHPSDGPTISPTDQVDRREMLKTALRELPDIQREVLTLRYFFDLPVEQTAQILGVPEGTVSHVPWPCAPARGPRRHGGRTVLNDDDLGRAIRDLSSDIHPTPRLMQRLHDIPDHTRRSRPPRWLLAPAGIALTATIAALILIVTIAGPSARPALAFTTAGGATVRVTIGEIEAVAPATARLRTLGHVRAVAMTAGCRTPTTGIDYAIVRAHPTPRISLGNPPTDSSATEIVAAEQRAANRIVLAISTVTGTVPTCVPSTGAGPGFPGWRPIRTR